VRRAVVAAVRAGVPWDVAASKAGVSVYTIRKWREHGQKISQLFDATGALPTDCTTEDMDCLRFFDEVESAHNSAVDTFSRTIIKAGKKNWVAAAWWLERRARSIYGKQVEEVKQAPPAEEKKVMLYLPDNGRDPA
jgi:hypothetical protein